MKNSTLALLVLALVVLGGIYHLRSRPVREVGISTTTVSVLNDPKAAFDRITIQAPGRVIELQRRDAQWRVKVDGAWKDTDPTLVDPVVEMVRALSSSEKVSQGDSPGDYGLSGSTALTVTARQGEKTAGTFAVGNAGPGYRGNFVRFGDAKAIYLTRDMIRYHLDKSADDFREKRLFGGLHPDDVTALELTSVSGSVSLKQQNGTWSMAGALEETVANPTAVTGYLNQIANLRSAGEAEAAAWADAVSGSAQLTLSLTPRVGVPVQVELFGELPGKPGQVAVKSSYLDRPVMLPSYQLSSMRKEPSYFAGQ